MARRTFQAVQSLAERRAQLDRVAQQHGKVYLTTRQIAARLGVTTPGAVYYHCRENRMPHGRKGRSYVFDPERVDRWLASLGGVLPLAHVG